LGKVSLQGTLGAGGLIFAALLIYVAVFLKESEERKIEDLVAVWWLLVMERQEATRSALPAFVQVVTVKKSKNLDRISEPKSGLWAALSGSVAVWFLTLNLESRPHLLRDLNANSAISL